MKAFEFELLRDIAEDGQKDMAGAKMNPDYSVTMENLERSGLIKGGKITEDGLQALKPYKVDNAIIMAAGFSARCMPLSKVMPKGLFLVKGESLMEREIRQLIDAGIREIIVVTGYLHEKFDFLADKYGVKLIYNKDYDKYNNMSSLYAARDYLKNSYVLCSDNYYEENVFHQYVLDSYYSCIYSEKFCDEFCVTELDDNGVITGIHRGGERAWYTIGDCYFTEDYSNVFKKFMNEEWSDLAVRNMLMDDFQMKHIADLPMQMKERSQGAILEFDTLEEIRDFDSDFKKFEEKNLDKKNSVNKVFTKYEEVRSYHSVPTEQLTGRLHLNENLFKPSPKCFEVLKTITEEDLYLYDLSHDDYLLDAISEQTGISTNNIFIHDGSAEVIKSMFSILLNEGDKVLIPNPGWSYYKSVSDAKFAKCIPYEVRDIGDTYAYNIEDILSKAKENSPKIIVITSPQMPTGCEISEADIERIISLNEQSVILLDEAYWGFQGDSSEFEHYLITKYANVVVSRTFSKFYGLANIRIGYGLCSYPLRRTIGLDLPLFRASSISRKMATAAVRDKEYYDKMREEIAAVREWFISELNQMEGVKAYKTGSNFVFIRLENADADRVRAFMEENGILIRLFTDKDALRLRITIAPKDIMERVVLQLKRALL